MTTGVESIRLVPCRGPVDWIFEVWCRLVQKLDFHGPITQNELRLGSRSLRKRTEKSLLGATGRCLHGHYTVSTTSYCKIDGLEWDFDTNGRTKISGDRRLKNRRSTIYKLSFILSLNLYGSDYRVKLVHDRYTGTVQ